MSVTLETELTLFKRLEIGQETIQSKNEVFFSPFSLNCEISQQQSKKFNQTKKTKIIVRADVSRLCQLLSAARRINIFEEALPGERSTFNIELLSKPFVGQTCHGHE